MAVFSTNQNRQLYVVKSVVTSESAEPQNVGDIKVCSVTDGTKKQVYFKYMGEGGLMRSDLIDTDKICYAKLTHAKYLSRKLKTATVKLDTNVNGGKPIVGQDYIVRIYINNYLAPGDSNVAIKYGAVHAVASMKEDTSKFYNKLIESLEMNFSREVQPLLKFEPITSQLDSKTVTTGIKITEVAQPYNVGFMAQEPVNFEVAIVPVQYNGDDVIWAVTDEDTGKVAIEESTVVVNNGPKIADLEYFCMGERGDQYRDWVGAANRIPVKYMVDPTKGYHVLDMHYFFSDTGVNVQKSEKDIIFVSDSSVTSNPPIETLKTQIASKASITVQATTNS